MTFRPWQDREQTANTFIGWLLLSITTSSLAPSKYKLNTTKEKGIQLKKIEISMLAN